MILFGTMVNGITLWLLMKGVLLHQEQTYILDGTDVGYIADDTLTGTISSSNNFTIGGRTTYRFKGLEDEFAILEKIAKITTRHVIIILHIKITWQNHVVIRRNLKQPILE